MTIRTISATAAGVLLAAGLLAACSSGTTPQSPATTASTMQSATQSAAAAPSAEPTATATATSTAEATASAEATGPAQPSTLTLTVVDGKATGRVVVKGTDQGVADAEVTLVFRPTGGGDATISAVTTDANGAFSSTSSASGAGMWTASFMGNKAATASAASATVS